MSEKPSILRETSLVPLSFVILIGGGIWSYGAMWQQVQTLNQEQLSMRADIKDMSHKLDLLLEKTNTVGYGPIASTDRLFTQSTRP